MSTGPEEVSLFRLKVFAVFVACLCGCVSTSADRQAATSQAQAGLNADLATWKFDFVDTNEDSLGHLVMAFTNESIGEAGCVDEHWRQLLVDEDRLDYDLGAELRPAYTLRGPWLTINLTASVCHIDHNLIGTISPDGASGYFTFSHDLGGHNIGRFFAQPIDGTDPQ